MQVAVIGLGVIGFPTACLFASGGFRVTGVDIDEARIKTLKAGKLPFNEQGLSELFASAKKNLTFQATIPDADVVVLCLPTPNDALGKADLSFLENVIKSLSTRIKENNLIIIESTVPPGTTRMLGTLLSDLSGLEQDKDFFMACCPERAFPGQLVYELINNDRIIGSDTERGQQRAQELYKAVCKGSVYLTNTKTAEFVKIIENTYRNVNIAFANELALLADQLKINVFEAIKLANHHPRVHIHEPGIGIGGHCIPVDPRFITSENTPLINCGIKINDSMPIHFAKLAEEQLKQVGKRIENSKIVILGAAYKPNIADGRESPTKVLADELAKKGAKLVIHDPFVKKLANYFIVSDLLENVGSADVIIIATAHSCYRTLDWTVIKEKMNNNPIIIDGRNLLENIPQGFLYRGLGK